ncbi:MAG: hypothetical protein ACE5GN_00210 [Waddliaceae bacterium]
MPTININPESEPVSSTPIHPSSADPTTAGEVARANKNRKDFSLDTEIGSLNDLKDKAPEVYDKMMIGIAYSIVRRMRQHAEKLKKMMREGREG